mgnify:CR=1 FL=1
MFIIQCDFDETITIGDLGTSIVDAFGSNLWHESERDYLSGKISVEETSRIQYSLVGVNQEQLEQFVEKSVVIRSGFGEFERYCRTQNLSLVIVSSGLDIYIKPTLKMLNLLNIECYTATGKYKNGGIEISYRDPNGISIKEGFKEAYLKYLRERDLPIIYIGDSMSDIEPAKAADYIFARGKLKVELDHAGIKFWAFNTFYDIIEKIDKLLRN